ncbi:MAG: sugar transferase [Oscillatoria princeps RMCB-10]|jgi:anti-anti-sigma factor|nr:sugar transferase [Oscillatoria princeps RMCB-10]
MILVTVGTEQYQFNALMDWVEVLIRYGIIDRNEEVVVQYGSSTKIPDGAKVYQCLPESVFQAVVEEARVIVAHCGEGTAMLLESLGKPFILVPRTRRFGEHVDDHQIEMAEALEKQGVPVAWSVGDLARFMATPVPCRLIQNQNESKICQALSQRYGSQEYKKLMLVCSSGGHYKAMRQLKGFWSQFEEVCWVTFKTATTASELQAEKGRVYWAYSPTNRNIPNLIRNLMLAFKVILSREKPDLILSTGAGVAVPFLLIAKFFCGSQVIFVESKTRLKQLSLSARILEGLSGIDKLIVQGKQIASLYPNAQYIGEEPVAASREAAGLECKLQTLVSFNETLLLSTPPAFTQRAFREFKKHFLHGFPKEVRKIVLDMSQTKFIDSMALETLVDIHNIARTLGRQLALWSVGPEVRLTLSKAGLDGVLTIETATETVRAPSLTLPSTRQLPSAVPHPIGRVTDILGASIGLAIAAIVFIPISIAIKLESPGPILLSQVRCGLMGKRFRLWKFRSTAAGAEKLANPVSSRAIDNLVENVRDAKVTRVGRFLRKTGLEQLPEFWNVLVGEMSLVGRRALTEEDLNKYGLQDGSSLNVKPGMTGEWLEREGFPGRRGKYGMHRMAKIWLKLNRNWGGRRNRKKATMSQPPAGTDKVIYLQSEENVKTDQSQ